MPVIYLSHMFTKICSARNASGRLKNKKKDGNNAKDDGIYKKVEKRKDSHLMSSRARSRLCLEDRSSTLRVIFVTH